MLLFTGLTMIALLGFLGLALDSARGYVTRARLSRAVDAAALAGAKALRQGQDAADRRARSLAKANGVSPEQGIGLGVSFGVNGDGEQTVSVNASQNVPTMFMRVLGHTSMTVNSQAVAAVPPLDLVLVLDQSGSLDRAGVFDELQDAAKNFVDRFSEQIDQVGLVSFQVKAANHFSLAAPFKSTVRTKINQMRSVGDTNAREGLRFGHNQLTGPGVRPKSVRVVVFFTDGRPTAFRGTVSGQDRAMAVYTTRAGGRMRGYFNNPDALAINQVATASGCADALICFAMTEPSIRSRSRSDALQMAANIRRDKIFVYSIGLGNLGMADPLEVPDMPFLRAIANEGGVVSAAEPQGKAYFAPTGAELDAVFQEVAENILVRLAE